MQPFPRGLKPFFAIALGLGILVSLVQRWLMWRALAGAAPGRRHAALYTWHLGMLRADYYPTTGQHLVPWIRALAGGGTLLLLGVALVFLSWARRAEGRVS